MKRTFSTKIKIILLVAVLLTAAFTVISSVSGQTLPDIWTQTVITPLRTGLNKLTQQAEQYYSYMFRYEALKAENEMLQEELAQMEDNARLADSVQRENQRLRQLLELTSAHEDYKLVDAYIIGWSSTDWNNTCTINRGTSAGIEAGMCAITANGEVVGLVTEAGPNYAVVKTILDSTLEISAIIASSGYTGMVSGGYIQGYETLLQMDYLASSAIIRNKDQVVTAGSTVYPRNLILGHVVDAGIDDTGVAKYAILQPATEISSLEQVFIITDYSTE